MDEVTKRQNAAQGGELPVEDYLQHNMMTVDDGDGFHGDVCGEIFAAQYDDIMM